MKEGNTKGSLSVEMVLILVPFMLCFMTMLNLARFVQAEVIIHHAIVQTAKEISTYSYVLTKTGISSRMVETNGKSEKFLTDINKTSSSMMELGSAISTLGDTGALVDNMVSVFKSNVSQSAMSGAAAALSKSSVQKTLELTMDDPDSYLENIGIVDGVDGLDFSQSKWLSATEGKGEIEIVVTFTMKNNLFPMFDFGEHEYCLCASTLLW
ncbi:MAG: hypothetical protein KH268_06230 [Clostridiales bacterium]|nr:hypothetical protein [Clostridiales bacterium]